MTSHPEKAPDTERLAVHECWELLRGISVGRVGLWVEDHPEIFPINYTVDHGSVVFRTGQGTKLAAALADLPVAFEADSVDARTGVVWSVQITGSAAQIERTDDVLDAAALRLFPWQAGRKDHFIRITPDKVTGRRFTVAEPSMWWKDMDQGPHASSE
jgi:uncharacterized protein